MGKTANPERCVFVTLRELLDLCSDVVEEPLGDYVLLVGQRRSGSLIAPEV